MVLGKAKYTLKKMCFPKVVIISFTVKEKPGPGLEVAVTADKRCASISPAHDGARGGREGDRLHPHRQKDHKVNNKRDCFLTCQYQAKRKKLTEYIGKLLFLGKSALLGKNHECKISFIFWFGEKPTSNSTFKQEKGIKFFSFNCATDSDCRTSLHMYAVRRNLVSFYQETSGISF